MLCIKQSTLYNILCIIAKLSLQSCLIQTKLGSNLVTLECRKGGRRGGGTLAVLRSTVQISADLARTDLLSKHTQLTTQLNMNCSLITARGEILSDQKSHSAVNF